MTRTGHSGQGKMIEGRYFPPRASRAVPARLTGSIDMLELHLDGAARPLHVNVASVSDRLAGVPRKITFRDGGVLETLPDADLGVLEARDSRFFSLLAKIEGNTKAVALVTVLCVAAIFAVYRYGLPLLASAAAWATPQVVVDAIDYGTLETVDRAFFEPSQMEPGDRTRISGLFTDLVALSSIDARLEFRAGGTIGANAIALPGGTVIVTDELASLARSDDEIAGVLAHELGHIAGQHSLQQIYRILGVSVMIGIIGGDSSQLVGDVITQASALQTLAYTREFEADADRYSVALMVSADRNPVAFVDLLDRITGTEGQGEAGDTDWFSTHPGNADRRAAVTEQAADLGWKPN